MIDDWRFLPLGEAALLIECAIDDVALANRNSLALAQRIEGERINAVRSIVPAINSVLVRFDPLQIDHIEIERHINDLLTSIQPALDLPNRVIEITVRYGGEHGPDLDEVARTLRLSAQEIIVEHTARAHRVMMIGFAPGFAYIGPLPQSLHIPRRATPRAAVPAGSVAIAAGMTGIYPSRLPGGWHLIGRTDVTLFNPGNNSPSLLQAGDGVRFVAIA